MFEITKIPGELIEDLRDLKPEKHVEKVSFGAVLHFIQ